MYFDSHRHDEYSSFDGFGKPGELAIQAKELGYKALGIANHGNTHSHVSHYFACKEQGIKPILGVEGYFLPVHKEKTRGYHLCLYAKDKEGYGNLNRLMTEGEHQKYYNSIIDFNMLKKYSKGIIVTSACVGGYIPKALVSGNKKNAIRAAKRFKQLFGDDFYLEIQPYILSEEGLQEKLNYDLYMLGKKLNIKCILTSDSHYGKKEDFPTYLKMHEIAKHDFMDIEQTYEHRYMPSEKDISDRFLNMHSSNMNGNAKWSIPKPKAFLKEMLTNLDEMQEKVDGGILDKLDSGLPKYDEEKDSTELIKIKAKEGLKKRGKYNKRYIKRIKEELEVIHYHNFEDYFLMVADYVAWAKEQGIAVGPGRGSGCNSLINYVLYITDVDPVLFNLDFNRFLGKDKKGMPDIDVDFEQERRDEVINYILDKYPNNSAQICSYGLYQIDNLVNDLAKVCGMEGETTTIASTKKLIKKYYENDAIDFDELFRDSKVKYLNSQYDNFIIHFSKLFHKVRYIGKHAAGVAITKNNIQNYTTLRIDKSTGRYVTNYDLNDLQRLNVEKFDILGLVTMSSVAEMRRVTGNKEFNEEWANDEKILKAFNEGDTDGIFQFDKKSVQNLLAQIGIDGFNDVVAASAMNRPGPLTLGMPEQYKSNKDNPDIDQQDKIYYKYLEDSHGSIIYQEQILAIATKIGGMKMEDARRILKMSREGKSSYASNYNKYYKPFLKTFIKGANRYNISSDEATELFDSFLTYSFNKGHATGYGLISIEEMFYKVYHPTIYWYSKMKYAYDDNLRYKFKRNAVSQGIVIFLPHVNYSEPQDSLRKVDGEWAIQEGLTSIKGVGEKASNHIYKIRKQDGIYINKDDFIDRANNRAVHKGVIKKLETQGALEFRKRRYINRVVKYNSSMYSNS